ncbi:MAG: hypothetical protein M1537_06935 [Nitrospirae bacterium]|nr:MAG: hypothetical protein D084_Lepto4C00252G0002 [Leptospirillum sp. Group IV 'UBA BS']MCL4486044.1 hypothetical protein [Nitrospirota bacterium]MCL5285683.1 hypothetical protein [Nitrospirota bacterium]
MQLRHQRFDGDGFAGVRPVPADAFFSQSPVLELGIARVAESGKPFQRRGDCDLESPDFTIETDETRCIPHIEKPGGYHDSGQT